MTEQGRPSSQPISRREMIRATAAVVATSLIVGNAAPAHAAARPAALRFLTPAEHALLDELTEMIIPTDEQSPGARAAGVAGFIDDRLAESVDAEWQARWRSGLESVDALSRELNGSTFLEASPEQRLAVLTRMAANEQDPQTPMERFFAEVKGWTVRAYYTSSVGIHQDQEYKGNVYQTGEYAGFDAT
jgi:hypothetical protein